jgi:hypothetical protein
MKKFLLLLVAAVLVSGLVLSCAQPATSLEVTLKAGSAENVGSDSITVEPINGYNLITWKGTADASAKYTLYRKSIIDGEIDEGTIVTPSGIGSGVTPIKGIAYATDTQIVADAQYVYGVVSYGYKNNSQAGGGNTASPGEVMYVSDIVWQDEPEGGYVKAKKPAAGTELPAAPAVTATAVRVNTSKPSTSGTTDVADEIVITLKGLTPGYTYTLGIPWTNWFNPLASPAPAAMEERTWGRWNTDSAEYQTTLYTKGWIQINGNSDVFSIADYLDYEGTLELSAVSLGINDYSEASKSYDNWKARLYVRIGSGISGVTYPRTEADTGTADAGTGTRFASNEIKLLDIAK